MPAEALAAEIPSFPELFHKISPEQQNLICSGEPLFRPESHGSGRIQPATLDPKYLEGLDFIALR
jgi:hypothetical protein